MYETLHAFYFGKIWAAFKRHVRMTTPKSPKQPANLVRRKLLLHSHVADPARRDYWQHRKKGTVWAEFSLWSF